MKKYKGKGGYSVEGLEQRVIYQLDQVFMLRLETIFIYYTLILFLSFHIVPFDLFVRNKSIIITTC